MLKINIEKILIYPIVGIFDSERTAPQELWLDLALNIKRESTDDDIQTTLEYSELVERLTTKINQTRFFLIETLADYIIDICADNKFVTGVKINLYKPSALKNGLVKLEVEKIYASNFY
jgi:dihydroneopterin aldolase